MTIDISEKLGTCLLQVDQQLYELVNKINVLSAVHPINYSSEKARFFELKYSENPNFIYGEHNVDPFTLKRQLFNLPIDQIEDDDLAQIYCALVNAYTDKIDQFKTIGSSEFLYDSLRYFGEPMDKDIRNANFILHLPAASVKEPAMLDANAISSLLTSFGKQQGYTFDINIDNNMIANALVTGTTVKINEKALVSSMEGNALAHHEMGVHLVTTLNSRMQPLKVLSLGFPFSTITQEGMAILSEYLSGNLSIQRLKILALRVLAVESMIKEKSFRKTFLLLKEQFSVNDELAFTITARVYRGGGFTKDYMYLQGFQRILNAYEHEDCFNYLLLGKTSLEYLPQLKSLVEKEIFMPPSFITPAFVNPVIISDVDQYIAHAIR